MYWKSLSSGRGLASLEHKSMRNEEGENTRGPLTPPYSRWEKGQRMFRTKGEEGHFLGKRGRRKCSLRISSQVWRECKLTRTSIISYAGSGKKALLSGVITAPLVERRRRDLLEHAQRVDLELGKRRSPSMQGESIQRGKKGSTSSASWGGDPRNSRNRLLFVALIHRRERSTTRKKGVAVGRGRLTIILLSGFV